MEDLPDPPMNGQKIGFESEPGKSVPAQFKSLGLAWQASARDYRRAISKHAFSELQGLIIDFVLRKSIELGRHKARIPKRQHIAQLLGLDEADVSRWIRFLVTQSVIEVEGEFYSLCPPSSWTMPVRVKESVELVSLEAWLDELDPDKELLPSEPSLNDALREHFVESSLSNRIGSNRVVGESPTASSSQLVNHQPGSRLVGESPTDEEVSCTTRAGVDRSIDRLIESRSTSSRSGSIDRSIEGAVGDSPTSHDRAYASERLFSLIGEAERYGRSADLWRRALEEIPQKVITLCSEALHKKRTGGFNRTKSPNPAAAWLNASLRAELQMRYAKGFGKQALNRAD